MYFCCVPGDSSEDIGHYAFRKDAGANDHDSIAIAAQAGGRIQHIVLYFRFGQAMPGDSMVWCAPEGLRCGRCQMWSK